MALPPPAHVPPRACSWCLRTGTGGAGGMSHAGAGREPGSHLQCGEDRAPAEGRTDLQLCPGHHTALRGGSQGDLGQQCWPPIGLGPTVPTTPVRSPMPAPGQVCVRPGPSTPGKLHLCAGAQGRNQCLRYSPALPLQSESFLSLWL